MKLKCYDPVHDITQFRRGGGSASERLLTIAACEYSAGGGGGGFGDGGCGSGPGDTAGSATYPTSGSTGGVGAAAYQVAPPPPLYAGATSSVRGYAHVTSGDAVGLDTSDLTPLAIEHLAQGTRAPVRRVPCCLAVAFEIDSFCVGVGDMKGVHAYLRDRELTDKKITLARGHCCGRHLIF